MSNEIEDFLNGGGGAPSAKFSVVGTVVKGIVSAVEIQQRRGIEDGKPLTWPDGNPQMQLVVTVQTDEHDNAEDDGARRLFAKKPGAMLAAISDAVKATGASTLEVGGELAVQYTGDGEKKNPAYNAPKLFKAQYKAPAPVASSVSADELL